MQLVDQLLSAGEMDIYTESKFQMQREADLYSGPTILGKCPLAAAQVPPSLHVQPIAHGGSSKLCLQTKEETTPGMTCLRRTLMTMRGQPSALLSRQQPHQLLRPALPLPQRYCLAASSSTLVFSFRREGLGFMVALMCTLHCALCCGSPRQRLEWQQVVYHRT